MAIYEIIPTYKDSVTRSHCSFVYNNKRFEFDKEYDDLPEDPVASHQNFLSDCFSSASGKSSCVCRKFESYIRIGSGKYARKKIIIDRNGNKTCTNEHIKVAVFIDGIKTFHCTYSTKDELMKYIRICNQRRQKVNPNFELEHDKGKWTCTRNGVEIVLS